MIQKKKFVKTFRNTKTVQLVLLLLLEAAYVLVLTLNPALGTRLFEDRTLFILCTLSWILALNVNSFETSLLLPVSFSA